MVVPTWEYNLFSILFDEEKVFIVKLLEGEPSNFSDVFSGKIFFICETSWKVFATKSLSGSNPYSTENKLIQ